MYINLTEHPFVVKDANGEVTLNLPPALKEQVPRVKTTAVQFDTGEGGVPFFHSKMGAVTLLPEPVEGVIYIVSMAVRKAVPDRLDVASPNHIFRDKKGQPSHTDGLVFNEVDWMDAVRRMGGDCNLSWRVVGSHSELGNGILGYYRSEETAAYISEIISRKGGNVEVEPNE